MTVASLSPAVIAAVLGAALLHAIWNAIAHGIGDRLVGFALIGVVDLVIGGALAVLGGPLPPGAWVFAVASAVVHVVYNLLLLGSYQLGEFSQMYPLARGTSPWVVALVSVTVLGRSLSSAQVVGVEGPALPLLALARRGRSLPAQLRRHAVPGLCGGVISLAAYSVVLWAQTSGALAPIAALRETSIVFGALIGAVFLGESLGRRRRAVAAAVVIAGVLVLSLG